MTSTEKTMDRVPAPKRQETVNGTGGNDLRAGQSASGVVRKPTGYWPAHSHHPAVWAFGTTESEDY